MANSLPEYWISAYLDGELPESLKQQAEARLAADETARRELEEMREVRQLLQALPSNHLPSGFSASVLHRCERESLLPAAAEPAPGRTSVKSWGATIGTLVATAAMLFLAVKFIGTPTSRPPAAHSNRNAESPLAMNEKEKNSTKTAAPGKPELAMRDARTVKDQEGQAANPVRKELGKFARGNSAGKAGAPGANATTRNKVAARRRAPVEEKKAFGGAGNYKSKQKLADRARTDANRDSFRIRQAVPYLKLTGDRVAVIEVTAENVRETVGRLESLLQKQAIRTVGPKRQSDEQNRRFQQFDKLDGQKTSGQRRFVAVYVESTPEQLAAVMKAVGGQAGKVRLALKPPVSIREITLAESETDGGKKEKQLESYLAANKSLADAVRKGRSLARRQLRNAGGQFGKQESGAKPPGLPQNQKAARKSLPLKSTAKNGQKRAKSAPAGRAKPGGGKDTGSEKYESFQAKRESFQMRFWLPETWLAKKKHAQATGGKKSPKLEAKANESKSGARQAQPTQQGPVRVIFVFRQKP